MAIVSVGFEPPDWDVLGPLSLGLARTFQAPCRVAESHLDARFAYDAERDQYYSTAILEKLAAQAKGAARILGVASVDLYVPILTFVFGEAQLEGPCALVSSYRLPEPGRPELLRERLLKEATHELGHTYGLRHCEDWNCVMASSHSVERLDIKSAEFCPRCVKTIRQPRRPVSGLRRAT